MVKMKVPYHAGKHPNGYIRLSYVIYGTSNGMKLNYATNFHSDFGKKMLFLLKKKD